MEIYNDAKNYNNRIFDFGFNAETAPTKNVLGVIENEKVTIAEYPFNGFGVRKIMKGFDAVDFAIVEELGRSKYLSSIQIYQYIRLRGLFVSREGIRKRINKFLKYRLIREYILKNDELTNGLRFYDLDVKAIPIANECKVIFNRGNRIISEYKKQTENLYDTAEGIKRVVVGNMIILGLLMNGVKMKRFGILETMRIKGGTDAKNVIIRTASNVHIDDESHILYEVVRNTPDALDNLADKVSRYYNIVNDEEYKENNYYGYKTVPQLVICGENYEHNLRIDKYLREVGLYSEKDTIMYTEDLLYVQATLKNLYVLDETGNRTWYALPTQ